MAFKMPGYHILAVYVILVAYTGVNSIPISEWDAHHYPRHLIHHRSKRDTSAAAAIGSYANLTPQNRSICENGTNPSSIVTNTTARIAALRKLLDASGFDAYIIPTDDAHQSEYVSKYDERRPWISGFTGSSGTAVVTKTMAALWTDGRYFLQADAEIDCNWIFMKQGETGIPYYPFQWLTEVLPKGSKVGANPHLLTINSWKMYSTAFKGKLELVESKNDLIDQIWTENRPSEPSYSSLITLNITFTGKTWNDKISNIRKEMSNNKVQALIVTALDEVAWTFNMRALDIPYNPMFFAYAIIELDNTRLYLRNMSRLTSDVQAHLKVNRDGSCKAKDEPTLCVNVIDYIKTLDDIDALNDEVNISKIWVSPHSSAAIYNKVNETKRFERSSPILLMKAVKNKYEVDNYIRCQIRDSATLMEFMAMFEPSVQKGDEWNEVTAHVSLDNYRKRSKWNYGLSFDTISAFGSNGAIIHYSPQAATSKKIDTSGVYLLDSGGQYLDGTTDVTRSFHFGTPTDKQREAYTRVLMGVIDLATTIWPMGTYGRQIDARARAPLWRTGWNYRHGTGHGIGMFLNVHEGPQRVGGYSKYEKPLYENMFLSDEPGYYEPGKFGVRLETIVMVTKADTKYNFGGKQYLTFDPVTLVPFEPKLIKYELLKDEQKEWLNAYNSKCVDKVGSYLKEQGKTDAYKWLVSRTEHISTQTSRSSSLIPSLLALYMVSIMKLMYL